MTHYTGLPRRGQAPFHNFISSSSVMCSISLARYELFALKGHLAVHPKCISTLVLEGWPQHPLMKWAEAGSRLLVSNRGLVWEWLAFSEGCLQQECCVTSCCCSRSVAAAECAQNGSVCSRQWRSMGRPQEVAISAIPPQAPGQHGDWIVMWPCNI